VSDRERPWFDFTGMKDDNELNDQLESLFHEIVSLPDVPWYAYFVRRHNCMAFLHMCTRASQFVKFDEITRGRVTIRGGPTIYIHYYGSHMPNGLTGGFILDTCSGNNREHARKMNFLHALGYAHVKKIIDWSW